MKGRKTIIQAVVGRRLHTIPRNCPRNAPTYRRCVNKDHPGLHFLWEDNSKPRVALDILQLPTESEGLNLLDIKARNEAIDIMWLKDYLKLTPEQPEWALITDLIIDAAVLARTCKKARMNAFLQTWDTPMRGPRASLHPQCP
jgi:hypothetical protein